MEKGTITKIVEEKGFGFIRSEKGEEIFFHFRDIGGIDFFSATR